MNLCGSVVMPFSMLFLQIFLELIMQIGVSNLTVHLHETSDSLFFLHGVNKNARQVTEVLIVLWLLPLVHGH